MGLILSLLFRIVKIILILVGLYIAFVFTTIAYNILSQLPRKRRIPTTDSIWSSENYKACFERRDKWVHVESFVYEQFVEMQKLRGDMEKGREREICEREVVRLFWKYRNDQKGYNPPAEVNPQPPLPPIVGGIGGTPKVAVHVVAVTSCSLTMTTSSVFASGDRYQGGYEVFEVLWEERRGFRLRVKYVWHNETLPGSKLRQWFSVYVQLMSRFVVLKKVIAEMTGTVDEEVAKGEECAVRVEAEEREREKVA